LLNMLAKNPELKVIGRTSSFAFKGKQEDIREIGQKLGVGTLLEGSVRRSGNRVRITAQLVNTTDGFHLWSETYDRVLDDIFAVQDDIAKAVSTAMQVTLVGIVERNKKVNPESYALVLRAHQSVLQSTKESLAAAVELYQRAIALDPENARAWAGMATALAHQMVGGHTDYKEVYGRAKEAAQKALALDDSLPEAHGVMGFILTVLDLRLDEAGIAFRKAYSLAPNNSWIVCRLSFYEALFGRFDEALRLSKLAIELDPLNPAARYDRGRILAYADRLDEARDALSQALELSPDITPAHLFLGMVALLQEKFDEALSEMKKEKSAGFRNCGLAMVYHAMGEQQKSDRALADLHANGERWRFSLAMVYAYREEYDKSFECLESSVALGSAGLPQAKVHPFLRNLHSDPRWPVFLKKIGLAD